MSTDESVLCLWTICRHCLHILWRQFRTKTEQKYLHLSFKSVIKALPVIPPNPHTLR